MHDGHDHCYPLSADDGVVVVAVVGLAGHIQVGGCSKACSHSSAVLAVVTHGGNMIGMAQVIVFHLEGKIGNKQNRIYRLALACFHSFAGHVVVIVEQNMPDMVQAKAT